ncbi:hypothetical protein B0T19DRAFT_76581 [Cercophora scortea]|uniref:Uncharacterized protein n=1 Tax=Cercophora scortea TaxID=314031 RepID=A0AAE0MME2_9PEZI|nr:hypothetical protein B0T19DRAFT_76581 [Cercophora scortea]
MAWRTRLSILCLGAERLFWGDGLYIYISMPLREEFSCHFAFLPFLSFCLTVLLPICPYWITCWMSEDREPDQGKSKVLEGTHWLVAISHGRGFQY